MTEDYQNQRIAWVKCQVSTELWQLTGIPELSGRLTKEVINVLSKNHLG